MAQFNRILREFVCALIYAYQALIAPLLGPCCRFYPSCSEYAVMAVRQRGLMVGFLLIVGRLLRCHPWGGSGYDPVLPNREIDEWT